MNKNIYNGKFNILCSDDYNVDFDIPKNCNTEIIDDIIKVSNENAFATAQALSEKDGLMGGISTGANVWAAMQLAKRPEMEGKKIVTVGCSFGERYLSTPLAEKSREAVANATA